MQLLRNPTENTVGAAQRGKRKGESLFPVMQVQLAYHKLSGIYKNSLSVSLFCNVSQLFGLWECQVSRGQANKNISKCDTPGRMGWDGEGVEGAKTLQLGESDVTLNKGRQNGGHSIVKSGPCTQPYSTFHF